MSGPIARAAVRVRLVVVVSVLLLLLLLVRVALLVPVRLAALVGRTAQTAGIRGRGRAGGASVVRTARSTV